jgi:hypothetical protein
MSEEILYALFGFALFLCALYFTSGSKATHQPQQQKEHTMKTLTAPASVLRKSLGITRQKLDQNTPLSITISMDDVSCVQSVLDAYTCMYMYVCVVTLTVSFSI